MALTGLHIMFSYATDDGDRIYGALIGKPIGSDNIATTEVSTAAPSGGPAGSSPIARLRAAEDGYYAVGTGTPNAAAEPRGFLPSGETIDIVVSPGDKVAWLTA